MLAYFLLALHRVPARCTSGYRTAVCISMFLCCLHVDVSGPLCISTSARFHHNHLIFTTDSAEDCV